MDQVSELGDIFNIAFSHFNPLNLYEPHTFAYHNQNYDKPYTTDHVVKGIADCTSFFSFLLT